MTQGRNHSYSRQTSEAIRLLGRMIRLARKERKLTAEDVAERVGVTRLTLRKIENGDPKVSIGLAFEAATIVGVPLFDLSPASLRAEAERVESTLALLPKHTHAPRKEVKDDF
ncbi:MAG: helix-turn-helix transcriptional regulator [Sphingomonadales bacterium]